MEFHEKLQELRKQKGLTQEQLAERLYVSRTAISKWESGRGYPSIDSLKEISGFFQVSIDNLLSGEEILTAAKEDNRNKIQHFRDIAFGLLDCSAMMFFFMPLFGEKTGEVIAGVSLLSLSQTPAYVKIPCFIVTIALIVCGMVFGFTLMAWITIQFVIFPANAWSISYFFFGILQAATGYATWTFYQQEYFTVDEAEYPNIGTNPKELVVYFSRMGYTKRAALEAPVRAFCKRAHGQIKKVDYILVHYQKNRYFNIAKEMNELLGTRATHIRSICSRKGKVLAIYEA